MVDAAVRRGKELFKQQQHMLALIELAKALRAQPHSPDAEALALCAEVLVARNARSLQRVGRHLLLLHGDQVSTERELGARRFLGTQVVDADLGVRYTTAVPRLGVRLVLAVAVASSGAAAHGNL